MELLHTSIAGRVFALACMALCLAACGGDDGDEGDGNQPPSDDPVCDTVCFRFAASSTRSEFDVCNPETEISGRCPGSLSCGAPRTFGPESVPVTAPVCEFDESTMRELPVDLRSVTPGPEEIVPVDPVAVELVFRRAGEAWPTSSALGAGRLLVRPAGESGQVVLNELMPTSTDRLSAMLDRGEYDVVYIATARVDDLSVYPGSITTGVLEVKDAGEVVIDFDVRPVDYAIALDGQATLPNFSFLSIIAPGVTSAFVDSTDAPLSGRIWLPPGSYDISAQISGLGLRNDMPELVVGEGAEPTEYRFDNVTEIFSGTVTLNGGVYPGQGSGVSSGNVVLFRDGFS
ncbi:MAG: hypothetical protein AAFQ82_23030, partial [Myxococcota bacterium]